MKHNAIFLILLLCIILIAAYELGLLDFLIGLFLEYFSIESKTHSMIDQILN